MHTDRAGLARHGAIDVRNQHGIPGAAKRWPFREDCPSWTHESVSAFLSLQQWNAQASLFDRDPLQLVQELRLLAGSAIKDRVRQSEKSSARPEAFQVCPRSELFNCLRFGF